MADKVNSTNSVVGWLEKVVNLESKFGFFNILKSLLLVFLAACVAFFIINPIWFVQRFEDYVSERHGKAMEKRVQVDPWVRGELNNLSEVTQADRAWVIEFHNGTTSLGGLPFRYGDMTYEQPPRPTSLMDSNQNISLSRYPFITKLYTDGYWYGHVDELMTIDLSFYYKMRAEGINYLAIMLLQGTKSPIGFLAVSYEGEPEVEKQVIGRNIRNTAVKLCNWLDHE